jgi:hypothetical protein
MADQDIALAFREQLLTKLGLDYALLGKIYARKFV